MLLIDTSVWISVFRDRSGQVRQQLETLIANREVLLTRFTQLELLQGSLNEQDMSLRCVSRLRRTCYQIAK
jgi:predicted nucleic acid-binding protein